MGHGGGISHLPARSPGLGATGHFQMGKHKLCAYPRHSEQEDPGRGGWSYLFTRAGSRWRAAVSCPLQLSKMCQHSIQQLCSSAHPLDITNSLAEQRVFTAKHLPWFASFLIFSKSRIFNLLCFSMLGVVWAGWGLLV